MAWNLREYPSLDQLRTLLGGQSGYLHNSLKVYRTGEELVVAQYEEMDREVVLQFGLGVACYREDVLGSEVFDHLEGVDDCHRLIVCESDLALSRSLLFHFGFYVEHSFELMHTQYLVQKITNTPVRIV